MDTDPLASRRAMEHTTPEKKCVATHGPEAVVRRVREPGSNRFITCSCNGNSHHQPVEDE